MSDGPGGLDGPAQLRALLELLRSGGDAADAILRAGYARGVDSSIDEATMVEASVPDRALATEDAVVWDRPRVGRYVLVEPIGKGSFGSVWAAFDPELDRKVALKIVYLRRAEDGSHSSRASGQSGAGYEELLSEAQLPAQLGHPNIVSIHDVGWLDEGHSAAMGTRALYVVMEYLGGGTLGAWIEREQPSWREVLATFVAAGRGLEAAHRRDLVHLDFKPNNVMFDLDGRVRVLDFGLARVRRRSPPSESGTLPIAGTPSYMAPEQHSGDEPDPRSDQFAFGVALWEALWHERPYRSETNSMLELHELKLAGPPATPRKGSVPAHVRAVITRALAPAPADRFASMTELLAALEADPAARRRRWLTAGLVGVAAIAMAIGALEREDPCALAEDRFVAVWDARIDASLSEAFTAAEPELADAVMARVRDGLDGQIARWTEVRAQVCETGKAVGEQPAAAMSEEFLCLEAHLQRISALTRSLARAEQGTVARAADSVAQLADPEDCLLVRRGREARELDEPTRAALLEVREQLAEAEAELALARFELALAKTDETLAGAEATGDQGVLAELHLVRGRTLVRLGRYDEARAAFIAALRAAELADDEHLVVEIELALINGETKASHFNEAELVAAIVEGRLASGRADDPRLAILLDLMRCGYLVRQHRYDEARAAGQQGFARLRELDASDALTAADFQLALGNIEAESHGDLDAARAYYEAARATWTEAYGPGHPQIGVVHINMGAIDFRNADYAEALAHLLAAREIFTHVYAPEHPRVGMIHQNLAALYMLTGRYLEAVPASEEALAVFETTLGRDTAQYAVAESNLAALLSNLGRCVEALPLQDHVIAVYEADLEPNDARHLIAYGGKTACLWQLGREDEARAAVAHIEELMASVDPEEPRRSNGLYVLADARLREGQPEAALALANELIAMLDTGKLSEPDPVADSARLLGQALRTLGRLDEARERLSQILDAQLGGTGEDAHLSSWRIRLELGNIERAAARPGAARAHYQAAWTILDGYARSPAFGAEISLALATLDAEAEPARARTRAREAERVLLDEQTRPDLVAEADRLLGESP